MYQRCLRKTSKYYVSFRSCFPFRFSTHFFHSKLYEKKSAISFWFSVPGDASGLLRTLRNIPIEKRGSDGGTDTTPVGDDCERWKREEKNMSSVTKLLNTIIDSSSTLFQKCLIARPLIFGLNKMGVTNKQKVKSRLGSQPKIVSYSSFQIVFFWKL